MIIDIQNIDVNNKTVLLRTDFNVPVENGKITNDFRIIRSLDTIKYLLKNNAKIIIISHRGRPKGKRNDELSLKIVKNKLADILKTDIEFIDDFTDNESKNKIKDLPFPSIIMLENIRFYKEEKENNEEMAKQLSMLGDIYINDGFAVSHRKHMSVYALPQFMKEKYPGILFKMEIDNLNKLLHYPQRPYIFIIGGSKISTKLDVVKNTLNHASTILLGGALAFTFLKAVGFNVGKSLVEEDMIEHCKDIYKLAEHKSVNIVLPIDFVVAKNKDSDTKIVHRNSFNDNDIGYDIGPMTVEIFKGAVESAKTIAWNGPMGVFENEKFKNGTEKIANVVADMTKRGAFTVAGGGDSVAALTQFHKENDVSFLSTGGGAMLEYLSGINLPGIDVLKNNDYKEA